GIRDFHVTGVQTCALPIFADVLEEAGVDQVIFISQTGKTRHEHICESLETFAREVLPEFAERDGAGRRAREERLAPAIAAALARDRKSVGEGKRGEAGGGW